MKMKTNFTFPGIIIANLGYAAGILFITYVLKLAVPFISILFWVIFYNGWAAYQMYTNAQRNSVAK